MRHTRVYYILFAYATGIALILTGVAVWRSAQGGVLRWGWEATVAMSNTSLGFRGLRIEYFQAFSGPYWSVEVTWWPPIVLGVCTVSGTYLLSRRRRFGRGFPVIPVDGGKR
jgi:hypothetical protein